MEMCNLGIFVPVYYSEESVAKTLMRLTSMSYTGIKPRLFICVTGMRESFKSFVEAYINAYSSDSVTIPIFDRVELIVDDLTFDPTRMINDVIHDNPDLQFISVVEPDIGIEDTECFLKFVTIYHDYDFKRKLGGVCTENAKHKILGDHIRWQVEHNTVVRSLDGDGFGNGVLFTERSTWKTVNGFIGRDYTNEFSKKCFRHGLLVTYAEGIK